MSFFRWLTGKPPPAKERALPAGGLSPPQRWSLDMPLLQLGRDTLTMRDALSGGIHVMGGTGSGKSSGPMATLIRAMMAQGWGMLFLCAKNTDADTYLGYAREAGREKHVIRITPSGEWRYNWLAEELKRPGGNIENILHLMTSVLLEIVEGKQVQNSSDPYWERAAKVLLRNSLSVLAVAEATIRLDDLSRFIASTPQSLEQVQDQGWQQTSYCALALEKADKQVSDRVMAHEMEIAARYFFQEFAAMSDRTRSSVVSTLGTAIDTLMHGLLYRLFSTDSTFSPEILSKGGIVIVDIPMVEYGEVARIAGMLIKHMTQLSLLRRQNPDRPCAIVVDESTFYLSPMDYEFVSLSRGSRAMSLYATQGLQNYHARLGAGADAAVKALLANFQTHILCRNNDVHTNAWAADVIARRWRSKTGSSSQNSMTGSSHGSSTNLSLEYPVQPGDFLHLRSGGSANGYCVDTIMVGRTWSNGDVYLPVTFHQR